MVSLFSGLFGTLQSMVSLFSGLFGTLQFIFYYFVVIPVGLEELV